MEVEDINLQNGQSVATCAAVEEASDAYYQTRTTIEEEEK